MACRQRPAGITAQARESRGAVSAEDAEAIRELVKETGPSRWWWPAADQNGEVGPQAAKVLAFVDTLRSVLEINIHTQDERFSTAAAQRALIGANMRRDKRKRVIDMVAAQHILQTYLDRQRSLGT